MQKLYQHQNDAKMFLELNPEGLLLAYDVGTGKTLTSLSYINDQRKLGKVHSALIVCPASLVGAWNRAIDDCVMFEGFTEDDVKEMKKIIFVTSYQKTYRTEKEQHKRINGEIYEKKNIVIRDEVDKMWDVIVCDESHNLGGHSSVQTKVCIKLATHAKCRIAMSGTPLHGGSGREDWEKMYGQIQFVTAGTRWKNWSDFTKQLVISFDKWYCPKEWEAEECRKIFQEYAISCRREDCVDLPGFVESNIPCELTEKKMYKDLIKGKFDDYNIKCDAAGAQYGKLLQIVSGSCKTETETLKLKTSKDDAIEEIFNGTNEKVIVFCRYTASVDRCMAVANKAGRNAVCFDGRSKGETWRQFQDGPSDVLVVQYDSGSAGLNLQAAHVCVFFEPTLSALKLEQAAGRIYRSGQKEKCLYYYLVTENTIEEKVWRTVRSGKDVNNLMLEEMAHGTL